jgi:ubiquinone/menaquinone biosynthesis C-methylase UbiE
VLDGNYMGRPLAEVMSWLGADWLVRPEREIEEEPERMLDALNLKPGMVVADVGAGVGYTSVRMARRVGPGGKVLATDVQPEMIRLLKQNLAEGRIKNVQPLLCTPDDPGLPEGQLDLAIMVDVYHECSHPVETLRGIRQALKPGGRLVLVEFRAEDPDVPIKPEHKMSVAQVRKELEPQGFVFQQVHEFLPWQHILVFAKPAAAPAPAKDAVRPANPVAAGSVER